MTIMFRLTGVIILTLLVFSTVRAEQFTITVGVELVNVLFSVTDDRGRFVSGLGPEDFVVEEDGELQEVLYFARENELPLTLALLLDTSPSVRPVFEEEQRTAVAFLESILRPQDLSLLIGFDRLVTLVQDFTESPSLLAEAIYSLQIGSGTSVYDAVFLASEDKLRDEAGRKAIILISDGEDTTSRVQLNEALIAAHQADAIVYSISNSLQRRRGFFGRRGPASGDIQTLEELSEETGGAVFVLEAQDEFDSIFAQIAEELRTQYSLGYVSTNPARDGKYREIQIRPRDRNLRVRARRGYYAPSEDDR
jgi:Ca-activated chloride channel family protein